MTETAVEGYELSIQQKNCIRQKNSEKIGFNRCLIAIYGILDLDFLRESLNEIISNHEIWRTEFQKISGMIMPLQVIRKESEIGLEVIDYTNKNLVSETLKLDDVQESFGDSLSFKLLKFADDRHFLLVTTLAVSSDEKTFLNFISELGERYAILSSEKPPKDFETIQYVDFSEWQNSLFEDEEAPRYENYWKEKIKSLRVKPLPKSDFVQNDDSQENKSSIFSQLLSSETVSNIDKLAEKTESSKPVVCLTIWQILLSFLNQQKEIAVNLQFDGRGLENLENSFGLYARFLPYVLSIRKDVSFGENVEEGKRFFEENSENQYFFKDEYYSEMENLEDVKPNVSFIYLNSDRVKTKKTTFFMSDFRCEYENHTLLFEILEKEQETQLKIYFDKTNFDDAEIRRIARMFEVLVNETALKPDEKIERLNILPIDDKKKILEVFNRPKENNDLQCLHRKFENQATETPDDIAVRENEKSLTFRELNANANKLGRYLRKNGVEIETPVGILVGKADGLLTLILAIWKCGGIYVPLDISSPQDRLKAIIETNSLKYVITDSKHKNLVSGLNTNTIFIDEKEKNIEIESGENLDLEINSENLSYIIYTSGSTGIPKGVMIRHKSVANLLNALDESIYKRFESRLRVAVNAPIVFDASIKQLVQISNGNTLIPIPEDVRLDPKILADFVVRENIQVLDCTPSHLLLLLETKLFTESSDLKAVLIGGENINRKMWERLSEISHIAFFNVYGPTECTVDATVKKIEKNSNISIGTPIKNVQVYLLDENLNLAPIGVKAEIYIGGEGVGRGYLSDAAKTSEKFLPNPFIQERGERMYATGDIARYLPDGNIEYLGRADRQVKVRGFRIELGEIEKVLQTHPAIQDAIIIFDKKENDSMNLIAYCVPRRKFTRQIDGYQRYDLPNKLSVVQQNKNETDYLFEEIFDKEIYFQNGIGLSENPVIVDVGANIGMFSLAVLEKNPAAVIYAFEALPPIYEKLRINIELYGENVKIFPIGLSNENKSEIFTYYPQYSMMSGLSSYSSAEADTKVIETYLENQTELGISGAETLLTHSDSLISPRFEEKQEHRVFLTTLSEFIESEGIQSIDLLKIDVQRAEMDVLQGIKPEHWQKIRQIVMEVHDAAGEESEGRVGKICSLLQKFGFETLAEQDDIMKGTDRFNLYASKNTDFPLKKDLTQSDANKPNLPNLAERAYPLEKHHLREYFKEKLPDYMIPNSIVLLDKMPLNENGKIDVKALPSPDAEQKNTKNHVAPTTSFEKEIAAVWQEVLNLEKVGIHDNFFDLGGHSLLIVQLHSQICQKLNCEIAMVELFQYPTVHSLAQKLSNGNNDDEIIQRASAKANKQREMMKKQAKLRRV